MRTAIAPSTSGATLYHYAPDDCVVKTAPAGPVRDRVVEQAEFMMKVGSVCFPRVKGMTEAGYCMELLHPVEWTEDRIEGGVFREAKELLHEHVWCPYVMTVRAVELLGTDHYLYVRQMCQERAPHLMSKIMLWLTVARCFKATWVKEVHGDPTVDNMMQRADGSLVMIDPIPASSKMPSLLAVDLGKMLQSARGYEQVKYGYHPLGARLSCEREIFRGETDDDCHLAEYFHAVHLLRLIPYQPEHLRPTFLSRLEEACRAVRV